MRAAPATPSGPQPSAPAGLSQQAPQGHLPSGRAPNAPSSPYYFLGDAQTSVPAQPTYARPREDRVSARSFNLPGDGVLRDLLTDTRREPQPAAQPQQGYYFLPKDSLPKGAGGRRWAVALTQPST